MAQPGDVVDLTGTPVAARFGGTVEGFVAFLREQYGDDAIAEVDPPPASSPDEAALAKPKRTRKPRARKPKE